MSLDVYLKLPGANVEHKGSGIFVRRNGRNVEITEAEWYEQNPDREPVRYVGPRDSDEVFHYNITHNLGNMAREAGIYDALWYPEEIPAVKAKDIAKRLSLGLLELCRDPDKYQKFNPENGWGTYTDLILFVSNYFCACVKFPEAIIEVSR